MDKFNEKFEFITPDGLKNMLTIPQARSFGDKRMNDRVDAILFDMKEAKKKKRKNDGFEPGWQPNLGMNVTCYGQYKRILKDRGLVEAGYHEFEQIKDPDEAILAGPEMARAMVQDAKIDLSGNEISAIESGEYFKD